jgi:biuret amidohydrolase
MGLEPPKKYLVKLAAKLKEGIVTNRAVVSLDYILDIAHPDGKVAHSAKSTAERAVTAAANQARVIARPKDWLSVLVKLGFIRGYVDQPKRSPVFDRAQELGAVELDTPGTAFHPDLDDSLAHRVITKPRVSGFYGTGLDETLRARHVERLIVAGFSGSLTVQSTAREAHDRDSEVYVLQDACTAADGEVHPAGHPGGTRRPCQRVRPSQRHAHPPLRLVAALQKVLGADVTLCLDMRSFRGPAPLQLHGARATRSAGGCLLLHTPWRPDRSADHSS